MHILWLYKGAHALMTGSFFVLICTAETYNAALKSYSAI